MRVISLLPLLALAVACSRPATPERGTESPATQSQQARPADPPSETPSELSHGEAAVGTGRTPGDRTADAPPRSTQRMHRIRMATVHTQHVVAPGVVYEAWTFDSAVPGPVVRVTVGDTVEFTLVNDSPMLHSMDFHAAEIAPSRAFVNVNPGDSLSFRFVARVPGAFMYHCGTAPTAAHIANGMYGAIIVDPARPLPPAREFVVVQSEFYMTPSTGEGIPRRLDWNRMLNLSPDYIVFNGVAAQYSAKPIEVDVGERLRFYVVNAGPNRVSAFHIVGSMLDRIYVGGFSAPIEGVQTWNVPVGGGAIFEAHLAEEGFYPFVTHAFADATKGAVGVLKAGNPSGGAGH
jgi:nitrite reductase (NO-forming)